jgi:hypothetical protein
VIIRIYLRRYKTFHVKAVWPESEILDEQREADIAIPELEKASKVPNTYQNRQYLTY